jgi:hypothetical protein
MSHNIHSALTGKCPGTSVKIAKEILCLQSWWNSSTLSAGSSLGSRITTSGVRALSEAVGSWWFGSVRSMTGAIAALVGSQGF